MTSLAKWVSPGAGRVQTLLRLIGRVLGALAPLEAPQGLRDAYPVLGHTLTVTTGPISSKTPGMRVLTAEPVQFRGIGKLLAIATGRESVDPERSHDEELCRFRSSR